HGGQGSDPSLQEGLLLIAAGAVRVVGGERLLGEDVEAGEEAEGLVEVEVTDVTAPLLVEQLQRQQREQRRVGGNHLRTGVVRLGDQAVEAQYAEQGEEQEGAGGARAERSPRHEIQFPAVGDLPNFGPLSIFSAVGPGVSSSAIRKEKGGVAPPRQAARKRQAIDLSVETLYPNRSATSASGTPSRKMARRAS